ncbi:P-loop containing nucleoside triphosphate hydrolase protein [Rozella allomycis CSF55]|uniref:ABC transporter domain-containing protein n=1 Tax=Rozella allomycis (strain CSF55) TaxID=988480 RepID=A0A075AUA3_ROZAC|nr:ABC transporter domain-containing protein [Rozella allomycis CSF55]RKP16962.1 P-loop containing nucleoside triphosphate hydrolase protein [Rozella allomycis CSF55]|eukprot:EPZ33735.1 ABC transporter domain-containing protein [Rozella allomycis CSF55]
MTVPYAMGQMVDIVTQPEKIGYSLSTVLWGMSGLFTIGIIANFARVFMFRVAGEKIIFKLRSDLYEHILKQDISFFDKTRTGELISRLSSDTQIVGKSLTSQLNDGLRATCQTIIGVAMMTAVSPYLSFVVLSIVSPIALSAVAYGRYVRKLGSDTQTAISKAMEIADERLSSIKTVKAFGNETRELYAYQDKIKRIYNLAIKETIASSGFYSLVISAGQISVGSLGSFLLYTVYVGSSMAMLSSFYSEVNKGIGASERIFEMLENNPKIESIKDHQLMLPKNRTPEIEFKEVSFVYPGRNQSVLNSISFELEAGKTTACVGHSGSGKSTLVQLLLRFYDPLEGSIKIDGLELKDISLTEWRKIIGLVNQEPILFDGTIEENIRYGNPDATEEEIIEASKMSNCYSFIMNFPDKFKTLVGEKGTSLSGGQKQRIAMARAFLRNPKILILDEASSALDAESEVLVQQSLERLVKGRTVLIIAHRLSTIRQADKIIVLNKGSIESMGSFDELLEDPNGSFSKLVNLQSINKHN